MLGSEIEAQETETVTYGKPERVTVIPLTYNVFIRRAERRMLGLRDKLADAPFLKQYLEEPQPAEEELDLKQATAAS